MSRMSGAARSGASAMYGVQGKMTRRLLGLVIGTQGLAVFFGALVARGLASATDPTTSGSFLLVGSMLAVLCLLDAGLMRRPWGVTIGWLLQLATLACAVVVPLMLLVGLLFATLWLTALVQGRQMDDHTRRVDAQWYAAHPATTTGSSEAEKADQGTAAQGTTAAETPAQDG